MLVNIRISFDFQGKRYIAGENTEVDPAVANRWIADGLAVYEADGFQQNPTPSPASTDAAMSQWLNTLPTDPLQLQLGTWYNNGGIPCRTQ